MHSILFLLQNGALHAPVSSLTGQLPNQDHTPVKVQFLAASNCNFDSAQQTPVNHTIVSWNFHPNVAVWGNYKWQRHCWKWMSINGGHPVAGSWHILLAGWRYPDWHYKAPDKWQPGSHSILNWIEWCNLASPRHLAFSKMCQPEGVVVLSQLKLAAKW